MTTGHALYMSLGTTPVTPVAPVTPAPDLPGNISVSQLTPTSVVVDWTASSGATGYRLERATNNGDFAVIATLGATTTHSDVDLTTGATYRYRVSATNAGGVSSASPVAMIVPTVPTSLAVPGNFAATSSAPGSVLLTWTGTTSAVAVVIQRSLDAGLTWTNLITLPGNLHSYTDATSRGTNYSYRISAKSYTAVSNVSGSVSLLTPPPDVSAIERTAVTQTSASLTWNPSAGATGYTIEESTDGVNYTVATNIPGGTVSATLTGLTTGTNYSVQIVATNSGGVSNELTLLGVLTIPSTPTNLQANVVSGPAVAISFSPVVGATSYLIERRTQDRPWGTLVLLQAPATSYTDVQVDANSSYDYRVTAINSSGSSDPSDFVTVGTGNGSSSIPTPTDLGASASPKGSVQLNWSSAGSIDGFIVQRLFGSAWKNISTVPGTVTSAPITGLSSGATAAVRVISLVKGVQSNPSSSIDVTALPGQVRAVKSLGIASNGALSLTWTAPAGSTVYKVERSTDKATWTTLTDSYNQALYGDSTLSPGTQYYYRVSAGNATGFGVPSAAFSYLTAPTSPGGVTTQGSGKTVTVSWTDVTGETGFRIQGSVDGVKWSQVAVAKANTTSATVKPGKNVLFRVAAFNKAGASDFSSPASLISQSMFSSVPVSNVLEVADWVDSRGSAWIF